jgi:6-phosphogluconolactonase/glucosamine-6-phosphate isomerase/deaminase
MISPTITTPLRQQYFQIKRQTPDMIVFSSGGFYEPFDDARKDAKACNIALTPRDMYVLLATPAINAAANILWLVAGAEKAATVRAVLRGVNRPEDLPAQLIQPSGGHMVWLLDREAASQISY